jgi:hypothetical protein
MIKTSIRKALLISLGINKIIAMPENPRLVLATVLSGSPTSGIPAQPPGHLNSLGGVPNLSSSPAKGGGKGGKAAKGGGKGGKAAKGGGRGGSGMPTVPPSGVSPTSNPSPISGISPIGAPNIPVNASSGYPNVRKGFISPEQPTASNFTRPANRSVMITIPNPTLTSTVVSGNRNNNIQMGLPGQVQISLIGSINSSLPSPSLGGLTRPGNLNISLFPDKPPISAVNSPNPKIDTTKMVTLNL